MLSKEEIVELQYEIAMAIGSSLNIKRMLRECLSTIQKRLNCPIGGVLKIEVESGTESSLTPILSIPFNAQTLPNVEEGIRYISDKLPKQIVSSDSISLPFKIQLKSGDWIQFFDLPNFGILYLYTVDAFLSDGGIRTLSQPLMQKLAVACKACLQNQKLEHTLSELKQAQSQLVQTEKMASLGILTAGVAHEINNPLNFLMGSYQGLNKYFNEPSSSNSVIIPKLLDSLKLGIDRISDIVNGLNLFSRNSGSIDEDCNLHDIIENCIVILQNLIKHKATVKRNYSTDEIVLKGNVGKLHQIFINILTNSVQAIESQGDIAISTRMINNEVVVVEISDTGLGIKPELLKSITDPFFTTKQPGEGTGLGLSITYSIIKEHGGSIEFESEESKGTKVILKFDLKK